MIFGLGSWYVPSGDDDGVSVETNFFILSLPIILNLRANKHYFIPYVFLVVERDDRLF